MKSLGEEGGRAGTQAPTLQFATGETAFMAGGTLVVADLHLGIERQFYLSGIKFPSQTSRIMERLDALVDVFRPKRLLILGDLKHKVPGISLQEMREIPEFLRHFSESLEIIVLPGNHDGGMEKLMPEGVKTGPSSGMMLDSVYFLHGHSWPGTGFLEAELVVMGHEHPCLEFRDLLGYRFMEQVWVRGELIPGGIMERYGMSGRGDGDEGPAARLPEALIMPAFNGLSGGIAVNREPGRRDSSGEEKNSYLGPLIKAIDERKAGAHLLDGTFLGTLHDLRKTRFGGGRSP